MEVNLDDPGAVEKEFRRMHNKLQVLYEKMAQLYFKRLKENLRRNRFGYRLAPATARRRKGVPVPLLDTYALYYSIRIEGTKVFSQGVHPSGIDMTRLWAIHEFGVLDKNIPARPYWETTLRQLEQEEFPALIKEVMNG